MKVVIAILILMSASFAVQGQKSLDQKLGRDDLVRYAILSKIIGPWLPGKDEPKRNVYIEIDGGNPSDELLFKLRKLDAHLKPWSEAYIDLEDGSSVKDKKTNKQGVMLHVGKINWLGDDEAKASAGSYLGNMADNGCTFTIRRENDAWKIVSVKSVLSPRMKRSLYRKNRSDFLEKEHRRTCELLSSDDLRTASSPKCVCGRQLRPD